MLKYSLIGDDYLLYESLTGNRGAGNPGIWENWRMDYFTKWNCNTARLAFAFDDTGRDTVCSIFAFDKMDAVLNIFSARQVKIILDLHNIGSDHYEYIGTQKFIQNWQELAAHYKNDYRVEGFNIYNEPALNSWGPHITDKHELIQSFGECIDEIRAIDNRRKIFFPVLAKMGIGLNEPDFVYDLLGTYGIRNKGNIVYDILHPYFFEVTHHSGQNAEDVAQYWIDNYLIPYKNLFGSENCWIGETFAFRPENGYTIEGQQRFLSEILKACINLNIGCQVWSFFGKLQYQEPAMLESGILAVPPPVEPPPVEPPITPPNLTGGLADLIQNLIDLLQDFLESFLGGFQ